MPPPPLDLLVLGSGVAGLSATVRAASRSAMRVGVLTKGELSQATTRWAQGGVAAVLAGDEDSADLHLADTLAAGAGLCDIDAVRVLVDEGGVRVNELIALGAVFDADHEGTLLRAREGGHSVPRVVHAGGAATGMEIERALVAAVRETAAAVLEDCFALDLLMEDGRCRGVVALDSEGRRVEVEANNVLLATGGAGQLFAVTTNPAESTGDGIAMALRLGAAVADVEFMQFHPTALHHPSMPRPLLSEALRGHGALLRDAQGQRFVDEMLPRDLVSRAMTARMAEEGVEHLWLDATRLERFGERFPTIAQSLERVGLDPSRDWLPIAPAAHYLSGGVLTDLDGATSVPGLWACGEAACTGVHGANRLASNSLLEGMVFGPRVIDALDRGQDGPRPTGAMRAVGAPGLEPGLIGGSLLDWTVEGREPVPGGPVGGPAKIRVELQRAMTNGAGVLRSRESLSETCDALRRLAPGLGPPTTPAALEVLNLFHVAGGLLAAAAAREESRGAHTRTDFPDTSPAFLRRLVINAGGGRRGR